MDDAGLILVAVEQNHLDNVGVFEHVLVGEDQPVRADDYPASEGVGHLRNAPLGLTGGKPQVSVGPNGHHAGLHPLGKVGEGVLQRFEVRDAVEFGWGARGTGGQHEQKPGAQTAPAQSSTQIISHAHVANPITRSACGFILIYYTVGRRTARIKG